MSDTGLLSGDFGSMNETDVLEIVVRPLLHRLGYVRIPTPTFGQRSRSDTRKRSSAGRSRARIQT